MLIVAVFLYFLLYLFNLFHSYLPNLLFFFLSFFIHENMSSIFYNVVNVNPSVLCISTRFQVLRAPESWSNYFFSAVFNLFYLFKPFSVYMCSRFLFFYTIGVRPDVLGIISIAVAWTGRRKLDLRQPLTRKIKDWGLIQKIFVFYWNFSSQKSAIKNCDSRAW